MKYLVVAFWSAIMGNILGYISSSLLNVTYNPVTAAIVAIIIGEIAVLLIPKISQSKNAR